MAIDTYRALARGRVQQLEDTLVNEQLVENRLV